MTRGASFLFLGLFFSFSASGGELAITSGGRRIIDRDPSTASTNCGGWVYGPSPVRDEGGAITRMYGVSARLADHCAHAIDSELRFGDELQLFERAHEGGWSAGRPVIDRTSFSWMNDHKFLEEHPEAFIGHLASPSVIRRDGRYFMAFTGSVDDRNLCAAEHTARTTCGSCADPWSYFVAMWAVSDDGVNWRVKERDRGDAKFIGRAPAATDRVPDSLFKGLARVMLVEHGQWFYIGAQYWTRCGIAILMFRVAYERDSEWGIAGEPEVWSRRTRRWLPLSEGTIPDEFHCGESSIPGMPGISSITRVQIGGQEHYVALAPNDGFRRSNTLFWLISDDLLDWRVSNLRSALPDFADGYTYDVSVIDPVVMEDADDRLHLFFASADGDPDHGVSRDGEHDCWLDPNIPTAPYVGTGIYESVIEEVPMRPTKVTVTPDVLSGRVGDTVRVTIEVSANGGPTPEGRVWFNGQQLRLENGRVVVEQRLGAPGSEIFSAFYSSPFGIWLSSVGSSLPVVVTPSTRRRAAGTGFAAPHRGGD